MSNLSGKLAAAALAVVMFASIAGSRRNAVAKEKSKSKKETVLKAGEKAPLFELKDQNGEVVKLEDFKGEGLVLLAFYPKDDSPICTKEMREFRDAREEFEKRGVRILGISTNSQKSHEEFRKKHDLPFPLLSDGTKETSKKYGVYNKLLGVSQRSYFLVDGDGVLRYVYVEKENAMHRSNETLLGSIDEILEKSGKNGGEKKD